MSRPYGIKNDSKRKVIGDVPQGTTLGNVPICCICLISGFSCVISFFQTIRMKKERGRISTFDISFQSDSSPAVGDKMISVVILLSSPILRLNLLEYAKKGDVKD